jgi:hypothetical protein
MGVIAYNSVIRYSTWKVIHHENIKHYKTSLNHKSPWSYKHLHVDLYIKDQPTVVILMTRKGV